MVMDGHNVIGQSGLMMPPHSDIMMLGIAWCNDASAPV